MLSVEVIAAAVLGSLIAGGTMMAFVTAARIARSPVGGVTAAGALGSAVDFGRNRMACDDRWFVESGCGYYGPEFPGKDFQPVPDIPLLKPTKGQADSMKPEWKAEPWDCSGDGQPDCVRIIARVKR